MSSSYLQHRLSSHTCTLPDKLELWDIPCRHSPDPFPQSCESFLNPEGRVCRCYWVQRFPWHMCVCVCVVHSPQGGIFGWGTVQSSAWFSVLIPPTFLHADGGLYSSLFTPPLREQSTWGPWMSSCWQTAPQSFQCVLGGWDRNEQVSLICRVTALIWSAVLMRKHE